MQITNYNLFFSYKQQGDTTQKSPLGKYLYLQGVQSLTVKTLKDYFRKYGRIQEINVGSGTKIGSNYGFVEFGKSSNVKAAFLHGQVHGEDNKARSHMIGDSQVIVRYKDPVRERVLDKMKQVCGLSTWIFYMHASVFKIEPKLPQMSQMGSVLCSYQTSFLYLSYGCWMYS